MEMPSHMLTRAKLAELQAAAARGHPKKAQRLSASSEDDQGARVYEPELHLSPNKISVLDDHGGVLPLLTFPPARKDAFFIGDNDDVTGDLEEEAAPLHPLSAKDRAHHGVDIVVGIMSARGNFQQRKAIRDTWGGDIKSSKDGVGDHVQIKFVVGGEPCPIHPQDRTNTYDCIPKPHPGDTGLVVDTPIFAHYIPTPSHGSRVPLGPVGADFDLHRWVSISHLGVFDSGQDGLLRKLRVQIWDRVTQTVVGQGLFEPGSKNEVRGSHRYVAVQPALVLQKGFRGSIVVVGYGENEPMLDRTQAEARHAHNTGGGIVTFHPHIRTGLFTDQFPDVIEQVPPPHTLSPSPSPTLPSWAVPSRAPGFADKL